MFLDLEYLDLIRRWGDYVAEIGRQLRFKYGLGLDPSPLQQSRWATRTEELIRQGFLREDAGARAAKELFSDFRTKAYAGEADTIAELLEALKRK